jgi:ABC-type branched-subunit amino acid transport system substrate-binding protein
MPLHRSTLLALFLLSAPALAQAPGVTDGEIAIGVSAPLSGPASAWSSIALAAEAWARLANAKGGVHGRKLRLVIKDDAYNPGQAVANVNEMKDSVLAMLCLLGTAVLNANKEALAEAGVPSIFPLGNPEVFAGMDKAKLRGVFMAYPDYADEGAFLVAQAVKLEGAKKIAVFHQNDDYGKGGVAGVRHGVAAAAGVAIAAEVSYEVADRELGTHALKLKESAADTLILYSTATHGAGVIKEMAKVGYRPRIFAAFPLGDRSVLFRLLGELWEGAYYDVNGAVPGEPEADRVLAAVLKEEPRLKGRESFALLGVTAAATLLEALQRAGRDLSREKLVRAMESLQNFSPERLTAPIFWSAARHHGLNAVRLMRAKKAAGATFETITDFQIFPAHF